MLTSARERLEVLKLRRAGKIHSSERSPRGAAAAAAAAAGPGGSTRSGSKTGAGQPRSIQREIVPHTAIMLDDNEKQVDYWKNIAIERDKELEVREAREREANRKFREDQKRILDDHMALRTAHAVNKPEVNRKERAVVDKIYEDYVAENKARKVHQREVSHDIGTLREEQIALKKKRLEAEAAERREFERRAVERAKEGMRQEQELLRAQREEAHKRRLRIAEDNERLKKIKLERKADIDAEDAKALARMTEVLEKQAAVSKAEFEKMKEKMKMRETIAFDLHETWMEQGKEDELRATRLTREREEAAARKEDSAAREAKMRTIQNKREVKRQAEERKKLREADVRQKELEKAQAREETESVRRIRESERAAKIAKQRAVEHELAEQIREQKRKQTVVMSDIERRMNSQFLPAEVEAPDSSRRLKLPNQIR